MYVYLIVIKYITFVYTYLSIKWLTVQCTVICTYACMNACRQPINAMYVCMYVCVCIYGINVSYVWMYKCMCSGKKCLHLRNEYWKAIL